MTQQRMKLKNISKQYPGTRALSEINLTLDAGEVHCIVGENGSGKSTLIKILSGVETPEAGAEIFIDGEKLARHNAHNAIAVGIQVIYQDMSLFPNLTVAENIAFQSKEHRGFPLPWKKIRELASRAMEEVGFSVPPQTLVEELTVAQRQLVEITRAMTRPLKLLILDEPTASLTQKEVNSLFQVILRLKGQGITTLFVSHRMNEIFEIAERITVFRDGINKGTYTTRELTEEKLVFLMSGQTQKAAPPAPLSPDAPKILSVRHLTRRGEYDDILFDLKKGEILGITGLLGSGRSELALSLFGMTAPDSGKILMEGQQKRFCSNEDAMREKICYVSEDRRNLGLLLEQSIRDNITITRLKDFLSRGFLDEQREKETAAEWISSLGIKIGFADDPVESLSGGNQQKVALSKWLSLSPRILILDQPTVGIDIIAKENIHTLVKKLAAEGMSIILISDEIGEVMKNSHRVLIMKEGRIVHDFFPEEESEEELLREYNLA